MSWLRAATHLADGANQLFEGWIDVLRGVGIDIEIDPDVDESLDTDVVFACGLLTASRVGSGQPLTVVAAPVFAGETTAVYRSVVVARSDSGIESLASSVGLRLAINEYGSWSGWHGFKRHLRENNVPPSAIGSHVMTGGHVNSIDAVLDGRADVASIDQSLWNARQEVDVRLADLMVIDATNDWPAPPISVRNTLPADLYMQLVQAIRSLPAVVPASLGDYAFMLDEVDEYPSWP